jgi:hypothetical protein
MGVVGTFSMFVMELASIGLQAKLTLGVTFSELQVC